METVRRRLGTRGKAELLDDKCSWRRFYGTGPDALRWHVELQLRVPYEHDPHVIESFMLEDHGQGLKVVRMHWNSEKLLAE